MSEHKSISIDGDDPLAELAEMVGETHDRVVIKKKGRTGAFGYLRTMPTTDFSAEWLADEYGAGSYNIAFKAGRNKFTKSLDFEIDESRKSRAERERDEQEKPTGKSDQGEIASILRDVLRKESGGDSNLLAVMQMMQEQSRQHAEAMAAQNAQTMQLIVASMNRPQPAPAPTGPAADIAGIMGVLVPLLKQPGNSQNADTWEKDMDRLMQLRELMEGKGDEDSKSGFGKFARIFGEAVSGFLEARGLMLPEEQTSPKQLKAPEDPTPPTQEQQMQDELEAIRNVCVENLPRLLDARRWHVPISKVADGILENAGENTAALGELLRHEQWKTILFNDDPRVSEHLTWFEKLREALLSKCGTAEQFVASLGNAENSAPGNVDPLPQNLPDARSDDDEQHEPEPKPD